MTRSYARFFGGCLALSGAFTAGPAHADTEAQPAVTPEVLRYEAPSGCPDRAEFVAAVAARGGNFTPSDARPELSFEVNVEPSAEGFHASLAVHNGNATSNPREVSGLSCAEVLDALAVVTAIALNPAGAESTPPPVAPVPVPASPRASQASDPARAPLHGATSFRWKQTVDVPAGKLRLDSDIEINARFGATWGLAKNRVLPRLDLSVSRANFVSAPNGQSYLTGTIAQLRVSLLADTTWNFRGVQAKVGGQEVGVGLCFSPHYDSAGWVLLGCAELSVGLIGIQEHGSGDVAGVHQYYPGSYDSFSITSSQGFGALGLSLAASYNLAAHFQVGASIAAQTLTSPITAYLPTDASELFHSSAVIATAVLGVGTHF